MINIILCGGSGTRLWPISRKLMPKQFSKLFDENSLFQKTVERNQKIFKNTVIVSNEEQYFIANDQLKEKGNSCGFLLEPVGKNTAPAIALACFALKPETIILVTPADHLIKKEKKYQKVIKKAVKEAENNFLVTFGIKPNSPHTGYGYIESDEHQVKSFKEKPDLKTAKEYLKKGNYYWNSGIFCFKAGVYLSELKKHSPKIYEASLSAYKNSIEEGNDDILRIKLEDMEKIPEDSIDYAVMEKSKIVKVVPSNIGWSDVGSFDALDEEIKKDKNGNTKCANHISIGSKNNFILTDKNIATIDVKDLLIIDTFDALLISKKGSSQKVKEIVKKLNDKKSELTKLHNKVYRPWGSYTTLENSSRYKLKKIVVKPNQRLSLQKHHHRSEHWVVVSGTALVTTNDKEKIVKVNESTFIAMGNVHRLENPGKIDLILIEVQVGEYTGEDDIIRLEDDYKRQ